MAIDVRELKDEVKKEELEYIADFLNEVHHIDSENKDNHYCWQIDENNNVVCVGPGVKYISPDFDKNQKEEAFLIEALHIQDAKINRLKKIGFSEQLIKDFNERLIEYQAKYSTLFIVPDNFYAELFRLAKNYYANKKTLANTVQEATAALLSDHFPTEMSYRIGFFLDKSDLRNLLLVNKATGEVVQNAGKKLMK